MQNFLQSMENIPHTKPVKVLVCCKLFSREIKEAFENLECHFSFMYLVTACLEALKNVLPAPLVVQAHIAWYTLAQAPHSQDNGGEWAWFTHCVLDLMGFPLDDKAMVMILMSSTRCFL